MDSIDGNVVQVLGQDKVNQLLEQVDPFDTYQFGGRAAEPTAGYLRRSGAGIEAVTTHTYENGQFVPKGTGPQNTGSCEATFVYTGSFNPYASEITHKARDALEMDKNTLLVNFRGDFNWLY